MAEPVIITLLGQPVPWARTGGGRGTMRFTPAKQRNNAATLRMAAQDAMRSYALHGRTYACGEARELLDEPVAIEVLAEFQIPASWSAKKRGRAVRGEIRPGVRPDYDNIAKQIGDALNGVVFRDDALIVDAHIRKIYGLQPKLVIQVSPIGGNVDAAAVPF